MSASRRALPGLPPRLIAGCLVASLTIAFLHRTAVAQQTTGGAPAATNAPNASRLLRTESSFWTMYGIRLSRSGQDDLGPGFLTRGLAEAVRGSPEGETHARRARTWAFVNQTLGLVALGLLAASLFTYADDHGGRIGGWPNFFGAEGGALALDLGWFASVTAAYLSREMTLREIMLSVNAYNLDVGTGRIP